MASSRATAASLSSAVLGPPGGGAGISLGDALVTFVNGTAVDDDADVDSAVSGFSSNLHASESSTATTSSLTRLSTSTDEVSDADERSRRLQRRRRLAGKGGRGHNRTRDPVVFRERRRLTADGADDDGAGGSFVVVLANFEPVIYGYSSIDYNLSCPLGFVGDVGRDCPGVPDTWVNISCLGLPFNRTLTCVSFEKPSCNLWSDADGAWDTTSCRPTNHTPWNVTCTCDAAVATDGGGGDFASGSAALAGSFGSMFAGAGAGAAVFLQNVLLLYTFSVMIGLSVASALIGIKRDRADKAAAAELAETRKQHAQERQAGPRMSAAYLEEALSHHDLAGVKEAHHELAVVNAKTYHELERESYPDWVHDSKMTATFIRAFSENHSFLVNSGLGPFSWQFPRPLRAVLLFTELLWVMVAQAVVFMLLFPDLGCEAFTTYDQCMSMTSPYGDGDGCIWHPDLVGGLDPPCTNMEPDPDDQFSPVPLLLAVVAMTCVAPFVVLVQVQVPALDPSRPQGASDRWRPFPLAHPCTRSSHHLFLHDPDPATPPPSPPLLTAVGVLEYLSRPCEEEGAGKQ